MLNRDTPVAGYPNQVFLSPNTWKILDGIDELVKKKYVVT